MSEEITAIDTTAQFAMAQLSLKGHHNVALAQSTWNITGTTQ